MICWSQSSNIRHLRIENEMRSKDTQTTHSILYIMTRKQFFIQVLDQFATNGDELLQILDDIESGEVECFLED